MWLLTETCCGIFLLRLCTRSKSHLFSSVPFPSLPFLHFSPILTVYFFFFPILPYFLSWLSIYFFPSLLRLKSNSLWHYFSTGSTQNFLPTGCGEMHTGTILYATCFVLHVLQCWRRLNHCRRMRRLTLTMWLQLFVILYRFEWIKLLCILNCSVIRRW